MEKFFKLQENQSTVRTEVVAGITTFLAAMYIIIVNPAILSATNMPMNGLITATILARHSAALPWDCMPTTPFSWRQAWG
jgi:AGZA family xanthine/uracil permease-like MFS transporter